MSVKRRAGLRHGLRVKDQVTRDAEQSASRRVVTVEAVEAESPAEAAGVKVGDRIEQIADVTVATTIDVERGFLDRPTGAKVPMKVRRGGETVGMELVLQQRPPAPSSAGDGIWVKLGLKLQPVGPVAVMQANPQLHGGMLVQDISPGSPAAVAGFLKGDVLVGLHNWETITYDNVTFVLNHKDFERFQPLKFFISRDGKLRDGWLNNMP